MQTIVPFNQNDEEVFVHTLIGIENTGNQSNSNFTPKIVTCFLPLLAIVNPIYVMLSEVGPHVSV